MLWVTPEVQQCSLALLVGEPGTPDSHCSQGSSAPCRLRMLPDTLEGAVVQTGALPGLQWKGPWAVEADLGA